MDLNYGRDLKGRWPRWFLISAVLGIASLIFPSQNYGGDHRIARGATHTLALQTDGTVYAWGDNFYGQLGDGSTTRSPFPVQVKDLAGVVAVSVGGYTSCVLKADGTVWAWGANNAYQIGDGTSGTKLLPVQVHNLSKITAISSNTHSLALRADGTVWTWGYNQFDTLGTNTRSPIQVSGLSDIQAIATGSGHSLALKSDGTVWAWGFNACGELGDGTTTHRAAPARISGLTGITAITSRLYSSYALKMDGTVWAWGQNSWGQLGDGTTNDRSTPTQVIGANGIEAIAAGDGYEFALKSDGTVLAWGTNQNGELGDGTTTQRWLPVQVLKLNGVLGIAAGIALKADGSAWAWGRNLYGQLGDGTFSNRLLPTQTLFAQRPEGYTMVSGGQEHSVALKAGAGGTARTWGSNIFWQLGCPGSDDSHTPILVPNLKGMKGVTAGGAGFHNLALDAQGGVWAWGYNFVGQVGNGIPSLKSSLIQIGNFNGVAAVAAGINHSFAIKADGSLWAWGHNEYGQLGDGTTVDKYSPVAIPGFNFVKAISGGARHSLALKSNGQVWAWGWNSYGQLGIGSTTDSSLPVFVAGVANVIKVAAGGSHSLALKSDGTIWAWGFNLRGQLGDGTTTMRTSPVQVTGLANIIAITAGGSHSLALKADGTVWAWGSNYSGQLGDGTFVEKWSPVQISGLSDITAIAAGGSHSLALKADGSVWAWGSNTNGRLGDGTTDMRGSPVCIANDNCTVIAPTGLQISVQPVDPETGQSPVTITFDKITEAGTVSVNKYDTSVGASNFRLASPLASYFISTTAEYEGKIIVFIHYDEPASPVEGGLQLLHYWDAGRCACKLFGIDPAFDYYSSGWENVTNPGYPDTLNNIICGTVTCFSPFIIGVPIAIEGPLAPVKPNTQIALSAPYNGEASAQWDFGDGAIEPATLSGTTWLGVHTYSKAGVYLVGLILFDAGGSRVGQAEYPDLVVYDPTSGFVTGGGWIDSPAGADPAYPELTGKANFSFEAKYQKGANVPGGNLELQFKEGGLNFKAKVIDWLAVAGAKAQFHGTGTINGTGSYKFKLTAIDAEADKSDEFSADGFRIKIWSEDGQGHQTVIYDNALGDNLATTEIGGGSIVIHKS